MKDGKSAADAELSAAPLALDGSAILHQMFRVRGREWKLLDRTRRSEIIASAVETLAAMERIEGGESALFDQIGHKGDLLLIHFRRDFDQLAKAGHELARTEFANFLEPSGSYLSAVELGLYELSVKLYGELADKGTKPHSPEWNHAIESELEAQRDKMAARLWPKIPANRYVCFYPMSKRRSEKHNWYALPIDERRRLMHDHGLVGRRYAGQVTQIISASTGLDDWEWGVDLFADDPMVFKRLVYEMRFDEASSRYAEFGQFHVGIRIAPADLSEILCGPESRSNE